VLYIDKIKTLAYFLLYKFYEVAIYIFEDGKLLKMAGLMFQCYTLTR